MIHHIEIYVNDIKESRQFYNMLFEKLGYTLFQEWDEGFSFKSGATYIVFVQVEAAYQTNGYHRKNIGLNHLAFSVSSQKGVDDLRALLIDQNVTLLYDDVYPYAGGDTHYAVYFEDPDRIKLEVAFSEA